MEALRAMRSSPTVGRAVRELLLRAGESDANVGLPGPGGVWGPTIIQEGGDDGGSGTIHVPPSVAARCAQASQDGGPRTSGSEAVIGPSRQDHNPGRDDVLGACVCGVAFAQVKGKGSSKAAALTTCGGDPAQRAA